MPHQLREDVWWTLGVVGKNTEATPGFMGGELLPFIGEIEPPLRYAIGGFLAKLRLSQFLKMIAKSSHVNIGELGKMPGPVGHDVVEVVHVLTIRCSERIITKKREMPIGTSRFSLR